MKLYTEEQVREAHQNGKNGGHNETWYETDEYVDLLTPIELPSDEEIVETNPYHKNSDFWYDGAKWLKEQILNQNK